MALIVEFDSDSSLAQEALGTVPDMRMEYEAAYLTTDQTLHWAVWATGGSFGAFEVALGEDPNIAAFDLFTELEDRRLYDFTVDADPDELAFTRMRDLGIQLLAVEHTVERTQSRLRCPSRAAYREFRDVWEERHGRCNTRRIFQEAHTGTDQGPLTSKQRDILCLGLDLGYFDVPRKATLGELSDVLDISNTAASQRIRRGLHDLVSDACDS